MHATTLRNLPFPVASVIFCYESYYFGNLIEYRGKEVVERKFCLHKVHYYLRHMARSDPKKQS